MRKKKQKNKNNKDVSKGNKKNIRSSVEKFLYSDSLTSNTTKFLLMTLATGGAVFGGAVLPGVLKVVKEFSDELDSMDSDKKKIYRKKISNSLSDMKRRNFVKVIENKNGKVSVKLTNKGLKRVREYSLEALEIKKPNKWDKKWRILIFDIPATSANFNSAREALRRKIKDLGFFQVQKSVWIYPYECEDELLFVAEMFGIQKYVEIIVAEKILHEKELKKKFKL